MNNQERINSQAKKIQLEIMDAVHSLCEKNGLTYYIIGGTALGAVRHHGFIPWDVDIDIAMPRKDYDCFVQQSSKMLEPSYFCKSYLNDSHHISPHALVAKRGTKIFFNFDEFNQSDIAREVYIDIMPLDNPPLSAKDQFRQERNIKLIKKLRVLKMGKVYATDNLIKRVIKKLVSMPFYLVSWKSINSWQDNVMKKYSNQDNGLLCSMASHFSYKKQNFEYEVYGTPVLYAFEDRQYYGPAQIDKYLTRLYGDYMKFPSVETRDKMFNFIKEVVE